MSKMIALNKTKCKFHFTIRRDDDYGNNKNYVHLIIT